MQGRPRSSVSWSSSGSAWSKRQQPTSSRTHKPEEPLNPGRIPRSLMKSRSCSGTVRFERPINRMRFSFTTAALCEPRRWQSTSDTPFHRFLPANWSASKKKPSTKTKCSSFAVLASLRLQRRVESALRKLCVLRKFTKRPTGTSASNSCQSSQEVWRNGSASSKRQFVKADRSHLTLSWSPDNNIPSTARRSSGVWSITRSQEYDAPKSSQGRKPQTKNA